MAAAAPLLRSDQGNKGRRPLNPGQVAGPANGTRPPSMHPCAPHPVSVLQVFIDFHTLDEGHILPTAYQDQNGLKSGIYPRGSSSLELPDQDNQTFQTK
eukprot:361801-Chlamydomonas_euryale.AAC.5